MSFWTGRKTVILIDTFFCGWTPTLVTKVSWVVCCSLMSTQMHQITKSYVNVTVSKKLNAALCSTATLLYLPTLFYCTSLMLFSQPQSVSLVCRCDYIKKKSCNIVFLLHLSRQRQWKNEEKTWSGGWVEVSVRGTRGSRWGTAAVCWLYNGSSVLGRQCQN